MSRGRKNLQEMEIGTKQSRTAVNASAKPGDSMAKLTTGIPAGQTGNWEDLGGPDPSNYRSTDDSAKLKDPAEILKTVQNIVNRNAKPAESMKKMKEAVDDEDYEEIDDEGYEYDEEDEDETLEEAAEKEEEEDEDEKPKKGKKSSKEKDEEDEDEEDEDEKDMNEELLEIESQIEEDVTALLSGEDLSEEFKFKARTVFEAALNARTEQIEETIVRKYEEQLAEEVQEISEAFAERINSYLEYVAQEWLEENILAVEQGLRAEMTESFLVGMKELFEDHYVTIPEDRYNVVEAMEEKLDDMETKLNEQIERNVALNKRLAESVTDVIFNDISEGLALSQKDKFATLAENVEFDGEENYREKLVTLKESYFPKIASNAKRNTQDYLVEDTSETTPYETQSGTMGVYLSALEKVSRK
jgi:hypothetical protein